MKRREGFTLVELLIVIIIVGVLAGMMMLSSSGSTDQAEAMKIVSNLRSLKAAVVLYKNEHGGELPESADALKPYTGMTALPEGYKLDTAKKFVSYTNTDIGIGHGSGVTGKKPEIGAILKEIADRDKTLWNEDAKGPYVGGTTVSMPF